MHHDRRWHHQTLFFCEGSPDTSWHWRVAVQPPPCSQVSRATTWHTMRQCRMPTKPRGHTAPEHDNLTRFTENTYIIGKKREENHNTTMPRIAYTWHGRAPLTRHFPLSLLPAVASVVRSMAPWQGRSVSPKEGPCYRECAHYVDNNSTPTIAPNLLQEKAFLFLHTSCQGAQRSVPLLCATIGPTSSSSVRQSLLSTTMPPRYPAVVVAPAEACDAKKSANARRAIMPRLALRPVCRSSRSR